MLQQFIDFCSSDTNLLWIGLWSDFSIAVAYFAIPIIMLVVLKDRKGDIPYPWLWTLFVTFIVACGLTHVAHVWSAMTGVQYLRLHAAIGAFTAAASVGTAIAFAFVLPEIKSLPSPKQQKRQLEERVAERTKEKDLLIREINHRVGNQLQVLYAFAMIEKRKARSGESTDLMDKLIAELKRLGDQHLTQSQQDHLQPAEKRPALKHAIS